MRAKLTILKFRADHIKFLAVKMDKCSMQYWFFFITLVVIKSQVFWDGNCIGGRPSISLHFEGTYCPQIQDRADEEEGPTER